MFIKNQQQGKLQPCYSTEEFTVKDINNRQLTLESDSGKSYKRNSALVKPAPVDDLRINTPAAGFSDSGMDTPAAEESLDRADKNDLPTGTVGSRNVHVSRPSRSKFPPNKFKDYVLS